MLCNSEFLWLWQYLRISFSSLEVSLLSRPGAALGFLTFLTGLPSQKPHSILATSKKFDKRLSSSLTVAAEIFYWFLYLYFQVFDLDMLQYLHLLFHQRINHLEKCLLNNATGSALEHSPSLELKLFHGKFLMRLLALSSS